MLSEFLKQFISEPRLARFEEVLAERTRHVTVVLENLFHEHNASACLRTCDCFGLQDVYIAEGANRFDANEDIALGSHRWLTLHQYTVPEKVSHDNTDATRECFESLRSRGYRIFATSPLQHSLPIADLPVDQPTAIVFGAEVNGVSQYALDNADGLVHIPMYGFTESFNVSVSVALILQQLTARFRNENIDWQLSDAERQELYDLWVRRSLGNKLAPLLRRYEQDQAVS